MQLVVVVFEVQEFPPGVGVLISRQGYNFKPTADP